MGITKGSGGYFLMLAPQRHKSSSYSFSCVLWFHYYNKMEDDQTKMMKEGYTESEIAAANWRKQNKLETSTTDSSAVRRVIRRNDDRRDGRRRSRSTGRNDHRQNFSSDDKRQDNKSLSDIEAPTIDEFGRTILPGQKISSNKNTDKDNRRNRSRSRSHDHRSRRSDSRNRSRSRSNTQPYSRENSRSRSRSYSPRYARKSESKWGHDKYDNHQAPEE